MPAYFDTGFSVREPMWHGLGMVLDEYPTDWADARTKAGLTWEPEERPAFIQRAASAFTTCRHCEQGVGELHDVECPLHVHEANVLQRHALPADAVYVDDSTVFCRLPDHKLIVRNDTELVLGVTSDGYSAIYHSDDEAERVDGASMEEVIDAFRGVDGSVKFETAGSVQEGRGVWALLYLDEVQVEGLVPGAQHLADRAGEGPGVADHPLAVVDQAGSAAAMLLRLRAGRGSASTNPRRIHVHARSRRHLVVVAAVTGLRCAPRPCSTCPYATSTPPCIWHPDEYANLARYDDNPGPLETFHCHQEQVTDEPTVCRGWLTVHAEGVAVRLAVAMNRVTVAQRDAAPVVELYETGAAAMVAGMRDIARPSRAALDAQAKLLARGRFTT